MSKRQLLFLGVIAVLCIAGGVGWYLSSQSSGGEAVAASVSAAPPEIITADEPHMLGNPKAKVTLIEYAAPRCPHCARFNANVFAPLKQAYIDTGKVHYVFRVFPLSEDDGNAEKLANCLPKAQYFAFMDTLFRNQAQWDDEYGVMDVRGALAKMALPSGLSVPQALACMNNKAADSTINQTVADGVARYQVNSTPTIVVNGKVVLPPPGEEWSIGALTKILDVANK